MHLDPLLFQLGSLLLLADSRIRFPKPQGPRSVHHDSVCPNLSSRGLTSIDVKDGEIKECEVEGIEKGKVVLVKTNGKVTALNANCTHYGAPLAKGVVTPNGRIVCPWHGGEQ